MKLEVKQQMRLIIGFFVLVSALLGYFVHPYWLFFTMFVGLNLMQFALTNFCPLEIILKKLNGKQ